MVLDTTRSACCGVSVTVSVLLIRFASYWSEWLTDAFEVVAMELVTFATIVRVWVEPLLTAPTFQTPLLLVNVPAPVLEMNDRPTGNTSDSDTLVAVFGPELVTVTV